MLSNLTFRLTTLSHFFFNKNRRLSHPWKWGQPMVMILAVLTAMVLLFSVYAAVAEFQLIDQNYKISRAKETQKQYLELNRKLKIEHSNLTAIARLEQLAEKYGMAAPLPQQVVQLP
jgi:cell division protein FtsL